MKKSGNRFCTLRIFFFYLTQFLGLFKGFPKSLEIKKLIKTVPK